MSADRNHAITIGRYVHGYGDATGCRCCTSMPDYLLIIGPHVAEPLCARHMSQLAGAVDTLGVIRPGPARQERSIADIHMEITRRIDRLTERQIDPGLRP